MQNLSRKQRFEQKRMAMENERSSFISHWRDLNDYYMPRRGRFTTSDVNKGDKRNQKIIDSTGTFAMRTLRSGMMSGVTSPARPWFRLTTPDPGNAESGPVKDWLYVVTKRMETVFARSNLYNALPIVYGDLGIFGTAAMAVEEDFDTVIHCSVFPIGSYCIATDDKGKVNTFCRTYMMTVRQIIDKFCKDSDGKINLENVSDNVKRLWEANMVNEWIEVVYMICPNDDYNPGSYRSQNKKFISVYYESGGGSSSSNNSQHNPNFSAGVANEKYLRQGGMDRFRILAPRWEVSGEDIYGTDCPGMLCLGDVKALQTAEKRTAQAIEKMVMPPLVGPGSLRNVSISLLPGDITYQDARDGQQGLRPIHEVNPRIVELEQMKENMRQRIRKGCFEDLFLMLSTSDRREITAREIEERHEEKLWAIGPVLERLNTDMLDPLIDITFADMLKQGLIPDPPEELVGTSLKVEYVSVMSQAQKLIGLSSVERFTQYAAQVAAVNPNALDKVDVDQLIDVYGDLTGVPPGIIVTDEKVQEKRDARQQAAQQAEQMAALQQGAQTAKDLSQAQTESPSVLSNLLKGQV